jgi:hypothetical protein
LLPAASVSTGPSISYPVSPQPMLQRVLFPLEQHIPRRKQDANLLLSENPFAGKASISDKKARRLHAMIDGRTNVADLASATGMNAKEIYIALQILLDQQRIELYDPNGQLAKTLPLPG